ncbi:amidase [Actinoallomurus iriomotensis]|uniref:Amidase n=1 Tax=Actinoallomurus iriomotensis TaxID=478107 RepID=A0A9W6VNG5_9ACTN|nr:amidase [Actinoallomurus iriomotensis]GLY73447.1 amidase [Actinoallomurus iriomotensis]
MTIWLEKFTAQGDGPRLAVKDAIDVAGSPTTLACPVISERAEPAEHDAPVVAAARRQGARIVGKTNLTELCRAADGVNPWTGTPENPLDADRVPGGSSSGSAVAVALGEADVALGTDTGGSVRVPAACCGVTGLKTTHGRVPVDGVFPLAQTLDTVGPLGPDVAALTLGMTLMEPGFAPGPFDAGAMIGRLRPVGTPVAPEVDAAVDAALHAAGLIFADEPVDCWSAALDAGNRLILGEGFRAHRSLLAYPDRMSERIRRRIERGERITDGMFDEAYAARETLREVLGKLFERYPLLALPTITQPPPRIGAERDVDLTALTLPFNLSGDPALALPIPVEGSALPGSLQLVAPANEEGRLLAAGALIESALR